MAKAPHTVRLRTYQVGFGDCFLLSFIYPGDDARHVLIDFGTTALPDCCSEGHMVRVAEDIRSVTGGKLTAVIATHRHQDHVSGFAGQKDGLGSGDIIRSLEPDLVVQPWTEDPKAARSFSGPVTAATADSALVGTLDHMHALSELVLLEAGRPGADLRLGQHVCQQLSFLGQDNIQNRAAVENLMAMGKAGRAEYLCYGAKSALEGLLPGVKVRVLGPPTLRQSDKIKRQRSRDQEQFWHLQALAGRAAAAEVGTPRLFPDAAVIEGKPANTRWLVRRLQDSSAQQLLSIVRALDRAMNNTSLILLFTVGARRMLFPGDAQIENWLYALKEAPDAEANRAELAAVNVYKIGHHGSLNATPKSLWSLFFDSHHKRGPKSRQPLSTVCSTMDGKHGHESSHTEVPRHTLVTELEERSDYFSTQSLTTKGKIFRDFKWKVAG